MIYVILLIIPLRLNKKYLKFYLNKNLMHCVGLQASYIIPVCLELLADFSSCTDTFQKAKVLCFLCSLLSLSIFCCSSISFFFLYKPDLLSSQHFKTASQIKEKKKLRTKMHNGLNLDHLNSQGLNKQLVSTTLSHHDT